MKCNLFPFFLLFVVGRGPGRALNLTVPLGSGWVGSDDLGYGPGSGFSFEPVQTSDTRPLPGSFLTFSVDWKFLIIALMVETGIFTALALFLKTLQ